MSENPDHVNEGESERYTVITEREEVRRWADDNDVVPVTRGESGGSSRPEFARRDEMGSDHEERDWDSFLDEFEEQNLALAYTETEGGIGDHRLVDRSHAVDEHGQLRASVEKELLEGETVETEVTEREVVETEIVEEATIESEIVDSEVVDSEVVSTEIVDEKLVDVAVVELADAEVVHEGDRRYFDDDEVIQIEEEGTVALEIDETRTETVEQVEKRIIESRVVEQDVHEETRVEDESTDVDIDEAGIHDHLEKSDLLDTPADAVIDEQYIETEFDENNVATSTLTTHSTVENLIDERKVVFANVEDVVVEDSELVSEEVIQTDIVDSDMTAVTGGEANVDTTQSSETTMETETTGTDTATGTGTATDTEMSSERGEDVEITDKAMGRTVEMPDGEEIGIVSDVDEDKGVLYVDEDPSITDRIKAHLQWGDEEDTAKLTSDQLLKMRTDAVVVKGRERP